MNDCGCTTPECTCGTGYRTAQSDGAQMMGGRILGPTYEIRNDLVPVPSYNTWPEAQYARGQLVRDAQPAWVGPSSVGYYMFDPTDPNWYSVGPK